MDGIDSVPKKPFISLDLKWKKLFFYTYNKNKSLK